MPPSTPPRSRHPTTAWPEGVLAAQIALAAADGSAAETRPPAVVAEPERGQVQVFGVRRDYLAGLRRD